jgi:hypothetical protein
MNEAVTALTNLLLALEALVLGLFLLRRGLRFGPVRLLWGLFFLAVAVASALGGLVHGFSGALGPGRAATLWVATLVAVALAGLLAWAIATLQALSGRRRQIAFAGAAGAFLGVTGVVILLRPEFAVVVAYVVPALAVLCLVHMRHWLRVGDPASLWALVGLGLAALGTAVQAMGLELSARYFDHNATFHAILAVAFYCLFQGARRRWSVGAAGPTAGPARGTTGEGTGGGQG